MRLLGLPPPEGEGTDMNKMRAVLEEVRHERQRQRSRWGAKHDSGHSWPDWKYLMGLRLTYVNPQVEPARRHRALIELAALAIAAIEAQEG